jgi:hypothetical protein
MTHSSGLLPLYHAQAWVHLAQQARQWLAVVWHGLRTGKPWLQRVRQALNLQQGKQQAVAQVAQQRLRYQQKQAAYNTLMSPHVMSQGQRLNTVR